MIILFPLLPVSRRKNHLWYELKFFGKLCSLQFIRTLGTAKRQCNNGILPRMLKNHIDISSDITVWNYFFSSWEINLIGFKVEKKTYEKWKTSMKTMVFCPFNTKTFKGRANQECPDSTSSEAQTTSKGTPFFILRHIYNVESKIFLSNGHISGFRTAAPPDNCIIQDSKSAELICASWAFSGKRKKRPPLNWIFSFRKNI